MDAERAVLVVLYVLSFMLPLLGLVQLYRETIRAPVADPDADADFDTWTEKFVARVSDEAKSEVVRDLWLVGVGLAAGAAAGIWSLFL